jgi:hypothetical protein
MSLFDADWTIQTENLLPPCLRDVNLIELNGDFSPGDPQNDYINYILVSFPGHWKEFPLIGVGIINYLQGTQSAQVLQRAIRLQLTSDVFPKPYINVSKFPIVSINSVTFELK